MIYLLHHFFDHQETDHYSGKTKQMEAIQSTNQKLKQFPTTNSITPEGLTMGQKSNHKPRKLSTSFKKHR